MCLPKLGGLKIVLTKMVWVRRLLNEVSNDLPLHTTWLSKNRPPPPPPTPPQQPVKLVSFWRSSVETSIKLCMVAIHHTGGPP